MLEDTMMIPVFEYSKEDYVFQTDWNENAKSPFDNTLIEKWTIMQEQENYFNYKLTIDHWKVLPGKYRYLAQLNMNRALLRRKPVEMQSMKQKFDPNIFNFTKMDTKEIIFEIINKERNNIGNYLAINVSPQEFGHCLLLPAMYSCLPQVVTADNLLIAIELFLLSKLPALRMGFNGLCANASLNHLHFHVYYLHHQMLLETVEVEQLAGPCHVLIGFPSRGFVFQLATGQDVREFTRTVYRLVNFLQEEEKPYNIFITRGSGFNEKSHGLLRNYVRVYVWTRKPKYGAKEVSAFLPALSELFGHLVIRRKEDYETLSEEYVSNVMSDLTVEPFQSVVNQVREMFKEERS